MTVVALIGMPGSGKSTLAKTFCAESLGTFEHISSGAIATRLAMHDEATKQALELGDYAPEAAIRMEVMAEIERVRLEGKHVVLEGFPRRLAQVLVLEQGLKERPIYVHIECQTYTCLQRILQRKREHDEPDAIVSRFEAYFSDTVPMLKMLSDGADMETLNNNTSVSHAVNMLRALPNPNE